MSLFLRGDEGFEGEIVNLEQLERLCGLPSDVDRGFYEAEDRDLTAEALFEQLVARERKVTVPALVQHFGEEKVTQIEVHAGVRHRLYQDSDWAPMLAYLDGQLPEGAGLGMDEVRSFSSELLAEFDPEKHEPNREDGTGFLMYFLETGDDACLPYLGLRALVHAVEHDLELFDLEEDEPRWRKQLWPVPGDG